MVVVLTSGRVPDDVAAAVQNALVAQLTPMAGGRPVHALGAPELRSAIEACTDDACLGGLLAQAGAQAGVIARLATTRGRRVQASIEIRDPVSGTPRREAIALELPAAAEVPAALEAVTAQLEGAMPSPPPPPATLLVTTNIDGARVQLDGDDVGISPVGPVEVADGQHELLVTARGYLQVRRQLRIQPGENARFDATLTPIDAAAVGDASGSVDWQTDGAGGSGGDELTDQWWFWTAIGGGAAAIIAISIGIGVAVANSSTPAQLDPTGIPLPPITAGGM